MQELAVSSRLVRLLRSWDPPEAEAAGPDPAEGMAAWLGAFDTITLQATLGQLERLPQRPPAPVSALESAARDLAAEAAQVRDALLSAIAREVLPLAAARGPDAAWSTYAERQQELQRRMEQMTGDLREQVRSRIAVLSDRLRRLAVLDATLAPVLAGREQQLLPALAGPLKRRCAALRRAVPADSPEPTPEPPGWLADFDKDWRALLLAELELRLEPVQGLLDALDHELATRSDR